MSLRRSASKTSHQLDVHIQKRKLKISNSPSQTACSLKKYTQKIKSNRLGSTKILPNLKQQTKITLHIENVELKSEIMRYPLMQKYGFLERQNLNQTKDLIVISRIEQFYIEYNGLFNESYNNERISIQWIIISKAINIQKIQQQFDLNFQPIKFYFVKSVEASINNLNVRGLKCEYMQVSLEHFSNIINFQVYRNEYASIMEYSISQVKQSPKETSQLWLISEQNLQDLLYLDHSFYYFLDETSVLSSKILTPKTGQNFTYIIKNNHQAILQSLNIKQFDQNIQYQTIQAKLLKPQLHTYCQKIARNHLENELLIVAINFPNKKFKQITKLFDYIALGNQSIFSEKLNIHNIYYGKKIPQDILGVELDIQKNVESQVVRIKYYLQTLRRIVNLYHELRHHFFNFLVVAYGVQCSLAKQIKLLSKIQIINIESIGQLNKGQKNVILIGKLNKSQHQEVKKMKKVFIVDLNKTGDDHLVIHNQVILLMQKIVHHQEEAQQFVGSPKVLAFNIQLEEFQQDKIYINHYISYFNDVLERLEQNFAHVVLMEMNDYTVERQSKLSQIERLKNIMFQVYLKYGTEFIFRKNSAEYNFLKRQQIIIKIKQIKMKNEPFLPKGRSNSMLFASFQDYQNKIYSEIVEAQSTLIDYNKSTPNIHQLVTKELFIVVPKTTPYHSLMNRSTQTYTLLIYSNIEQVHQFTKYLTKNHFSAIFVGQKDDLKYLDRADSQHYQYFRIKLSEKYIRQKVDQIVDRFGYSRQNGNLGKLKKKIPAMVIYDNSDENQLKLISQMTHIFKQSKIITLPKVQFRKLKNNEELAEGLLIYQMGKVEIALTKKIRNVIELFKVFMSPHHSAFQFSAYKIQFSLKQIFLRSYYDQIKRNKLKGSLKTLSLARCLSPKRKSFINKSCLISQPGISFFSNINMTNILKCNIFANSKELLSLVFLSLQKGNIAVILLNQKLFNQYSKDVNIHANGIIWIITTSQLQKCIIKQVNIVYCVSGQQEVVINQVINKYKSIKNQVFELQQDQNNNQNKQLTLNIRNISVKILDEWPTLPQKYGQNDLRIMKMNKISKKIVHLEDLQNMLVFFDQFKVQSILSYLKNQSSQNIDIQAQLKQISENQTVYILAQAHNQQFLERSLQIINEDRVFIITYKILANIVLYSQLTKTIPIIQKKDELNIPHSLTLSPSDTPDHFSKKLKSYIEGIRKST